MADLILDSSLRLLSVAILEIPAQADGFMNIQQRQAHTLARISESNELLLMLPNQVDNLRNIAADE